MESEYNARDIAIMAHGTQKYGDLPYIVHLDAVQEILTGYGYDTNDYYDAAYLHDVVEDTEVTVADVHDMFGPEVAQLVNAVTGEGLNRSERQANILQKIRAYPNAAPLKLADRIANVLCAGKNGMYAQEHDQFSEVIKPLVNDGMYLFYETLIGPWLAQRYSK